MLMQRGSRWLQAQAACGVLLALAGLGACSSGTSSDPASSTSSGTAIPVKLVVGSALGSFCSGAVERFNATRATLADGSLIQASCEAQGSGDLVTNLISLVDLLKTGGIRAEDERFPTLFSLDGDIYHAQLVYQVEQRFPGQAYIPGPTDAPLVASSPMVFMTQADLAASLKGQADLFKAIPTAKSHRDLDPTAPAIPINYVHSAPTRSNSGLQTLVAQFASIAGKRPDELTLEDVKAAEPGVSAIQARVVRYGVSTNALARSMAQNGPFWASVGSVYESSVISANANLQPGQQRLVAVYPRATFNSTMRLILAGGPWISGPEREAAKKVSDYLLTQEMQQQVAEQGLRPGVPGVPLGAKFSSESGVETQPAFDSFRPPRPEVVDAMLKSWLEVTKKPSQVVLVVDSSGSMRGDKLPAVQQTLQLYLSRIGPKETVALIDFDNVIRPAVVVEGPKDVPSIGLSFVSSLEARGETRLYDATLEARNWLQTHYREGAINAVVVLTDGEDSGSQVSLDALGAELQKTGFKSDNRIGFFTVGYGNDGEFNADALKRIAELNGGYYSKGEPQTIGKLMADLQTEF